MPLDQMIGNMLSEAFALLLPDLMLLMVIGGFLGAAIYNAFFSLFDWLAERLTRKSRAKGFLAKQAIKAKAAQGEHERGDGAAGRACETSSDGAA